MNSRLSLFISRCCQFSREQKNDLDKCMEKEKCLFFPFHEARELSLVFTSDACTIASTSASIRALISPWKRGWHKHKQKQKDKHKDQNFSFSFSFRLRHVKTKPSMSTRKFATSGQLKHSFQIFCVWSFEQNGGCCGCYLLLMSTLVFTSISCLCLSLCLL